MLSVIIITKNEAKPIRRCLESVAWADEIIVLDSGSTDNTVEICREYTEKVFSTDWPGFGLQKQRALEQSRGEWVLSLDADEWLSPALQDEIRQAMSRSEFQAYEMPRSSSFCGKVMRHGGWWPDYVLRLFQRNAARFSQDPIHEHIVTEGKIGRLRNALDHESYVDLEEVLSKLNTYSSLSAAHLHAQGKRSSLGKALAKGFWTFFRCYILRAGLLDGRHGFILALFNAQVAYYKYLKLAMSQFSRS